MSHECSVKQLLKDLPTHPFVLGCGMQMGYAPGLPIMQIRNEQLCMMVPFLRYKMTGKTDQTLVYPIHYAVTLRLPEGQPVEYLDLSVDARFGKIDLGKPAGFFRHKAVQNLNREEYQALREELFMEYDRLSAALLYDEPYAQENEARMCKLLQMLTEPALWPMYRTLDPYFYQKYFE